MIYQISETSWVRFSVPSDWNKRLGDVCLYADEGTTCFVDRSVPGYLKIETFMLAPPYHPVSLHADEVQALCDHINAEKLQVTSLDVDDIVGDAMSLVFSPQNLVTA